MRNSKQAATLRLALALVAGQAHADGDVDDWRKRSPHEPGTAFEYNDVRVNLLAYALLHVWRKPLPLVLKEHIMDPIGASTTWRWYGYDTSWIEMDGVKVNSISGGGHFGGGLFINTLEQLFEKIDAALPPKKPGAHSA